MVIALSKASATVRLEKSMLFPSLAWLIPNRQGQIALKPVRSRLVGIGGASKYQKGEITMSTSKNDARPERRPEGKEGAGAHQEGRNSVQAGHTQRREKSEPQKGQPSSVNDHQKTVSGKKQHGPDDKVGRDAGGNEGSKGQNIDSRRSGGTGKEPSDIGDERGRSRTKQ
jgi:hypothetical protein